MRRIETAQASAADSSALCLMQAEAAAGRPDTRFPPDRMPEERSGHSESWLNARPGSGTRPGSEPVAWCGEGRAEHEGIGRHAIRT
jgi:hypothetical protein